LDQGKRRKGAGLTGSLKDFGLTDLFQLLGQQQKTGVLNLQEKKGRIVQIRFDKGMIVGVVLPLEKEEETSFGKRLIQGKLLSPEKWKKAFQLHKEELLSIESALLKSEGIRKEDLTAALRLHTFETIYNLFKWQEGTFWFETKEVNYDPTLLEPLNAEYFLLDVLRMVDEWPFLAKRIPTFRWVMQKVNPLATLDVLTGSIWEKNRSFQMEAIYDLVNGLHTVQEIIELSFLGEFDTCKNLIHMMDAGLIEPVPMQTKGGGKSGMRIGQHLWDGGIYLLVLILGLIFIFQFVATRREKFPFNQNERKVWVMTQDYLRKIEGERMGNAREIFFLETNRYPAHSEEMVKRRLFVR
jgi:hypothetical protein